MRGITGPVAGHYPRAASVSRHARLRGDSLAVRSLGRDAGLWQRPHCGAFLGPAAAGGGAVERQPAVVAFVVGEAADQPGLDRAVPAGQPQRGVVAGGEALLRHDEPPVPGPARGERGPLSAVLGGWPRLPAYRPGQAPAGLRFVHAGRLRLDLEELSLRPPDEAERYPLDEVCAVAGASRPVSGT